MFKWFILGVLIFLVLIALTAWYIMYDDAKRRGRKDEFLGKK